jgi:hypothetical protein
VEAGTTTTASCLFLFRDFLGLEDEQQLPMSFDEDRSYADFADRRIVGATEFEWFSELRFFAFFQIGKTVAIWFIALRSSCGSVI